MPFKPNYNQRRSERRRAQQEKVEQKQRRREEKAAQRKAARDDSPAVTDDPGNNERGNIMGRNNKKLPEKGFVLFDVLYEDGTRSSNRKIDVAELDPLDTDGSARALIEAQDSKISAMSGRPRGPIKSITRSPTG